MFSPNKISPPLFFCLIGFLTGQKLGIESKRSERRKEKGEGKEKNGERRNKERNERRMRERDKEDYRKLRGAGRPTISIASLDHLQGAGCSMVWPMTAGQVDQLTQMNPLNCRS